MVPTGRLESTKGEGTNGMSLAIELGAEFEEELEEALPKNGPMGGLMWDDCCG